MQYRKTIPKMAASRFFTIFATLAACTGYAQAQNTSPDFVQLRDGVIINKSKNEVYITTPQHRVQALGIAAGQALWTSSMDATPLAIANTKLICLAKGTTLNSLGGNEIGIVELDIARRGSRVGGYTELLPRNVNLNNTKNTNIVFTISPRWAQNNTYLSWRYTAFPMRGIYDAETRQQEVSPLIDSGAFRVEKVGGKLKGMLNSALPPNLNQQSPIIINNISAKDKFGQFVSADRLHTMTSTKFAGDSVFEHFRWEVFEGASGRKLGELTDYRSYAPFYVTGNTIVYEKGPYMLADKGNILSVPLQLVAVDITNGQTLWKKDIYDNVYRGSLPPAKTN
jgi:hypothetical protein